MGGENSKIKKKLNNITDEEFKQFMERFRTASGGRDRINKDQFGPLFSSVLTDYTLHFFIRMVKAEDCSLVHAKTILTSIDMGLGDYESLAKAMVICFGDEKDQVIRNMVKIFCETNKFTREDQVRLHDYFKQENQKPLEELEHFFSQCPLFPYCASYVFNRMMLRDADSKMPKLDERSQVMGNIDVLVLNSCLPFNRRKDWTLLYSNTRHGQSFSQMVKRINGEGPVLMVIRSTRGKRFGFFASNGFVAGPQYQGTAECFLFQLSPQLKTYSATGRTDNYAYLNYQQQSLPNGLGMGGQEDVWPIFLHEDFGNGICQKNSSHFEPCFLAEEEKFQIRIIEAWRPGEKPQKSFEELIESGGSPEKSVLDKDPEARAVLEMAGKSFTSDIYREPPPLLEEPKKD